MEENIVIKGVESNCRIKGEGRPLLILHGWGFGSSNSWFNVQKMLALQGFKVIVPDFPGFGKSGRPSFPWSVSDYADWLEELVDHFNLENFSVIAHSFGGRVIVKYLAENEGRINKLVLCSPAGVKPKKTVEAKLAFWISKAGNIVFDIRYLRKFRETIKSVFYLFLRKTDYVKAQGVMKETIKKILAEDLTPYLSGIKTETLLVWGERDRIVPLKYASVFKREIENSELKTIPKAAHSPHLENPEKLLETIIPFLR